MRDSTRLRWGSVVVTALLAPWMASAVAWLWAWLGDEGAGRRALQLDARGRAS